MILDFNFAGECRVSMPSFVDTELPPPHPLQLLTFCIPRFCSPLSTDKSQAFHSEVMKLQYLAKRARPVILLPVV